MKVLAPTINYQIGDISKIPVIYKQQIDKYYKRIGGIDNISTNEKISAISEKITNLTFKDFLKVNQKAKANTPQGEDKERKKALVNLYLTIIYLFYKNLININFRYVIAFNCLERDNQIHGIEKDGNYFDLTKLFIKKEYINRHARENLTLNISNASNDVIHIYRNSVAHFNAITKANVYVKDIYKRDIWKTS
ncbi:MAG: hypothetical protein PHC83_08750 [Bacteroidales bacterium]|nr:hypothetical protein [Bacteroidales bacterium]